MIKRTWEDVKKKKKNPEFKRRFIFLNSLFYLSTHAAGHDMEKSLHVVYVTCLYYS